MNSLHELICSLRSDAKNCREAALVEAFQGLSHDDRLRIAARFHARADGIDFAADRLVAWDDLTEQIAKLAA